MPFTLAHPAAAVPFRRSLGRAGVLSALVIGSMSPDFAYFVPWTVDMMVGRSWSHSIPGIFWFCLPTAALVYVVFHLVVKAPALMLLPAGLHRRWAALVEDTPGLPAVPTWGVATAMVIGAFTHIVWDAFTHWGALGLRIFPVLGITLGHLVGQPVQVYQVLQHASTLLGMGLLAWWMWWWAARTPDPSLVWRLPRMSEAARAAVLAGIAVVSLVSGLIGGLNAARGEHGFRAFEAFAWYGVVSTMAGFGLAVLVYSVLWRGLRRRVQQS